MAFFLHNLWPDILNYLECEHVLCSKVRGANASLGDLINSQHSSEENSPIKEQGLVRDNWKCFMHLFCVKPTSQCTNLLCLQKALSQQVFAVGKWIRVLSLRYYCVQFPTASKMLTHIWKCCICHFSYHNMLIRLNILWNLHLYTFACLIYF